MIDSVKRDGKFNCTVRFKVLPLIQAMSIVNIEHRLF